MNLLLCDTQTKRRGAAGEQSLPDEIARKMLSILISGLGFQLPAPELMTRRQAIGSVASVIGATTVQLAAPMPAYAQGSKLIPKSSAESTASFKAFQLSQPKYAPGQESEAFKAAEKSRRDRASGVTKSSGGVDDDLRRLGLKPMSDTDQCFTSAGKPYNCRP